MTRILLFLILLYCASYAASADGVRVVTQQAERAEVFREIRVTGTVTSPNEATLSPAVQGLVERVDVDAGSVVAAGDTLLMLDAELTRHALDAARAARQQAQAALADAERRFGEAEALGPRGSIARTQIDTLQAEVAEDRAALARATADAAYQQALLDRHQLKAPFAGVISRREAAPGEWITPGQNAFVLVALDGLRIDLNLSEDYLTALDDNAHIRFALDADPDTLIDGTLLSVVPVADASRTFLVRIVPTEPLAAMRPGMGASAVLNVPTGRSGLLVSRDALLRNADGRISVWTTGSDPRNPVATERFVRIGETFEGHAEVIDGLPEGEAVIVVGNEGLRAGQPLQPDSRS